MTILGKALGGGVYPISAVLADEPVRLFLLLLLLLLFRSARCPQVMGTMSPGVHGSTFGGNPLACAVSVASLRVLLDENLAERAEALGAIFQEEVSPLLDGGLVRESRGRGLLQVPTCHAYPTATPRAPLCHPSVTGARARRWRSRGGGHGCDGVVHAAQGRWRAREADARDDRTIRTAARHPGRGAPLIPRDRAEIRRRSRADLGPISG